MKESAEAVSSTHVPAPWSTLEAQLAEFERPWGTRIAPVGVNAGRILTMAKAMGAGSGVNLSTVRSSREPVSRGGLASGPVSFMRGADAWAASIRSGGRARRSARMIVLDVDHPDLLEFIWSKANEEKRASALLEAGYPREEAERLISFQQGNVRRGLDRDQEQNEGEAPHKHHRQQHDADRRQGTAYPVDDSGCGCRCQK